MGDQGQNEIRVTDKRRVYLDEDRAATSPVEDVPNLKPKYVEELEARTLAAERQVQEVQSRFEQIKQQLQRETDETRVRLNRAADERATAANARLISSLLPVMDDLDRAIQAANESHDQTALLSGLKGIATLFRNALLSAGVESISAVGEDFDPQLHEAVDTAEADDNLDGKVVEEYARGFKLGDRLLRPARVKVGRARQTRRASE